MPPRLCTLPLSLLMLSLAPSAAGQLLTGGGATFPQPIYSKWIESFERQRPEFSIRYEPCGSEAGAKRVEEGAFDFAGSDMPLSDPQIARLPFPVVHFPTVLGAVVPIYHIPGVVADLRVTPEILAGIYLGKIRKWNDPAIRSVNRGVSFPDREIAVVHRSDGSGTTFVWTDYLSKVSAEWKAAVGSGTTIHWPTGIGVPGNEGVAHAVSQTENSIGYVEFIYALEGRLSYALVRNGSGKFVQAGLDSLGQAAPAWRSACQTIFAFRSRTRPEPRRILSPRSPISWLRRVSPMRERKPPSGSFCVGC